MVDRMVGQWAVELGYDVVGQLDGPRAAQWVG